ncbi:COX15/CtaA family protein [Halovulum dunhuangense]|uniref:Heme A synthase n=1 Tax=Halovulum dunhuangense TaxID=1505036 RepID=A0A849L2P8_9RHOB|nr:heme A synthase [Halovulum dunhuangense]NNU80596.1 COX15/CtaA family protein [Halovulum dunhuangense]
MTAKRSIFEEVSGKTQAAPAPRRADPREGARTAIRIWMMVLFALVVVMIAVGGLTRLTDSGLSITEWAPVTGAIPPMSDAAWQLEFDKYREIPQYRLMNAGMTLEEFKFIYWWEWGHRQLGRFIGLVWGLGFFWFLIRRRIPVGWTPKLLALGALGGLQGAIGWWMVASGLTGDMISVASYRLATHLGIAFVILGLLAWYIYELRQPQMALIQARRRREGGAMGATLVVGMVFVQVLLGALVAGIDAGRTYVTWPLMDGGLVPDNALIMDPVWRNFFENAGTVQFIHRMWAYGLLLVTLAVWWRARKLSVTALRRRFDWLMVAMLGQTVIGVVTVLYGAPWEIAIVHQFGAVVLFALALRARFGALYPPEQRIARA